MSNPSRYRDVARAQLRDAIVDAARELTIAHGWDAVRMAQVAAVVGVSRQTVYNEFTNKAGLAEALAVREVTRFVGDVRTNLFAHGEDIRAGAYAAILHVLREAAANPLIKAILTSARGGSDELLPFLTTRAELVLVAATAVMQEWAQAHAPGVPEDEFAFGAESIVRVVVSHIVLPTSSAEDTARGLSELAAQYVAALRARSSP
ncbi:MAG TPA: TetR family transcriptional regulator [Rugosimonospora sp.]|nr:TetR family transcriptional regulator [Rugosimonospora sp.]